ncbi:hypothetical protein [Paraburkholderia sp. C35]|uniref:hypothetical protein n=1 Tax=Paraburkholderia sp. C35 TaxID=2126993 RepID=UPI000D68F45D|nr:hypothetical protein [Paraburkholderia sp. C35]
MKLFVRTLVIATALAAPVLSHAQQSTPADQQQQPQSNVTDSSYGGSMNGKAQAGSQATPGLMQRNDNTQRDNCVGPVSYCNIFFGS